MVKGAAMALDRVQAPDLATAGKQETAGHHIALNRVVDAVNAEADYLGDLEAIEAILRNHLSDMMQRWAAVDSEAKRAAAIEADKAMCKHLAAVFLGQVKGYQVVGAWNTEGEIARYCAERIGMDPNADPMVVMVDVFALLVREMYTALTWAQEGRPEDDWQTKIDGAIEDWTYMLAGLPPPE